MAPIAPTEFAPAWYQDTSHWTTATYCRSTPTTDNRHPGQLPPRTGVGNLLSAGMRTKSTGLQPFTNCRNCMSCLVVLYVMNLPLFPTSCKRSNSTAEGHRLNNLPVPSIPGMLALICFSC